MTHKIIIDTDPGIDDAMAIFFAIQSTEIDILGLTTVFGNVPVSLATENALKLLAVANQDIPVFKGAESPYFGYEPGYAYFVHGEDGLGNIELPAAATSAENRKAAEFIVEMARKFPNEVTIVPIGPLTNIALALKLEPELPKLIKAVNIMGGAAFVPGNVTPLAEANIWNDPFAADIVFSADWQVNMFGLDVTYAAPFPASFVNQLAKNNKILGGLIEEAAQFYIEFYSQKRTERVCFFHDAFPIAYIISPQIFTLSTGHMRIGIDSLDRGQTSFAPPGTTTSQLWTSRPLVKVATKVDHSALTDLFLNTYANKE